MVIRRVGGLEVYGLMKTYDMNVIRRVGGLEEPARGKKHHAGRYPPSRRFRR